jgi:CelD/BcsL family acetyltransferase involved in cellulose biosynthesis
MFHLMSGAVSPAEDITVPRRIGVVAGAGLRNLDFWSTPFQSTEWREAWNRAIGVSRNVTPFTTILTQSQQILAVLPLAVQKTPKLRILTWHSSELSDYCAPIVAREKLTTFCRLDGQQLLRQIAQAAGGVDLIFLPRQPLLICGLTNPLVLPRSVHHHAGAHAINFGPVQGWDDFLARKRSAATRRQLRKKVRLLEEAGTVGFHIASNYEESRNIAVHCLAAKSRQLAKLGHYDPFLSINARPFLEDFFASGTGQSTWAVALTLNDEPVATAIGFASSDEWLLYQMAMDCDHVAHTSPGTQLLMRIMQHCIATGIRRLDLGLGDESYKFEWCDEHQTLMTSLLPLTFRGRLAAAGLGAKVNAQRLIAENPRLYEYGKGLKRRLRQVGLPV